MYPRAKIARPFYPREAAGLTSTCRAMLRHFDFLSVREEFGADSCCWQRNVRCWRRGERQASPFQTLVTDASVSDAST
jgi:hypothetical protein